jgi:cytochrome c5
MKSLLCATMFLIFTLTVAGFLVAQTSGPAKSDTTAKQETTSTQQPMDMHPVHRMHMLSGDDAYKQNCTRCHSEVPPVSARRTKTIVRHMRVRANITAEEAQAILQYLTQ